MRPEFEKRLDGIFKYFHAKENEVGISNEDKIKIMV